MNKQTETEMLAEGQTETAIQTTVREPAEWEFLKGRADDLGSLAKVCFWMVPVALGAAVVLTFPQAFIIAGAVFALGAVSGVVAQLMHIRVLLMKKEL